MLQAALRLFGVDLHHQVQRLADRVADAKREFYSELRGAITEIKGEALDTGINIGLVVVAAEFAFLAVVAGLVAFFLWMAPLHGPMAAICAIGFGLLLVACALFGVAKTRSTRRPALPPRVDREVRVPVPAPLPPVRPAAPIQPAPIQPVTRVAAAARARALAPVFLHVATNGSLSPDMKERLSTHGAAAAEELTEMAEEVFRNGSRKAIFGTILMTMLAGVIVGSRWRR